MTDPDLESEIMRAERPWYVPPGGDRFSQPPVTKIIQPKKLNFMKELHDIDALLAKAQDQLSKMQNLLASDAYHQTQALAYLQRANRKLAALNAENAGNCHCAISPSAPASKG